MSSFSSRFERDAEHPEWHHSYTNRPVMKSSTVKYRIWSDGQCFTEDAYDFEEMIAVDAHCEARADIGSLHEECWNYIKLHSDQIEKELRRKLWAICQENFEEFLENVDADDPEWVKLSNLAKWNDPNSLDVQVELREIVLFDYGFDEAGFCTFEFDTWDEEHGISILMHKNHVLASSGRADFTGRGSSIIGHAKCIQEFGFTEGDFRIEN